MEAIMSDRAHRSASSSFQNFAIPIFSYGFLRFYGQVLEMRPRFKET